MRQKIWPDQIGRQILRRNGRTYRRLRRWNGSKDTEWTGGGLNGVNDAGLKQAVFQCFISETDLSLRYTSGETVNRFTLRHSVVRVILGSRAVSPRLPLERRGAERMARPSPRVCPAGG